jgi:hypothetical protein
VLPFRVAEKPPLQRVRCRCVGGSGDPDAGEQSVGQRGGSRTGAASGAAADRNACTAVLPLSRVARLKGRGAATSLVRLARGRRTRKTERRAHWVGARRSGRVGSGRPLSGAIGARGKTTSERHRAAAALIRPWRTDQRVVQPIGRRPADYPGRCRLRRLRRGEVVFPRRETGGPSRVARAGQAADHARAGNRLSEPRADRPSAVVACSRVASRKHLGA